MHINYICIVIKKSNYVASYLQQIGKQQKLFSEWFGTILTYKKYLHNNGFNLNFEHACVKIVASGLSATCSYTQKSLPREARKQ